MDRTIHKTNRGVQSPCVLSFVFDVFMLHLLFFYPISLPTQPFNQCQIATIPSTLPFQVGGTVGDIESMVFLEALRQFQFTVGGRENILFVHVSLVPVLGAGGGEQKTKPTQHSVKVKWKSV